jgi:uncharacterized protein (TIGR02271 family)
MADTRSERSHVERIRPGASVDTPDAHVGRVERVTPDAIVVVVEQTGRRLTVPSDRVLQVWPDGSVQLSGTRAEIERLIERGTAAEPGATAERVQADETQTVQLQEERLVAHKELEEAGRVRIRKEVEEVPRRLEVEAYYEDVEIEHVPIGRIVKEQEPPREEDGVYIVPVYEEQLVVVKRLLLKEEIHIRRHGATETRLFEDTVRRERLVVEDPDQTGLVREQHYADELEGEPLDEMDFDADEGAVLVRPTRIVRLFEPPAE